MDYSINVQTFSRKIIPLYVNENTTIKEIKDMMSFTIKITNEQQRYVFAGKHLEDYFTLKHCCINECNTIFIFIR